MVFSHGLHADVARVDGQRGCAACHTLACLVPDRERHPSSAGQRKAFGTSGDAGE